MSSLKKLDKANQRVHRERSQPSARKYLGELEKKKDYQKRARDHEAKEKTLKKLRQKALEKNPDEFYYHMINSKMENGVHVEKKKAAENKEEQEKLMKCQDVRYVTLKLQMERKKIEKLRANLHILDQHNSRSNTHTFFVDSKEEAQNFDAAKRLETHPSLLSRTFNRPRLDDLRRKTAISDATKMDLELAHRQKRLLYDELTKRIEREKELRIVYEKLLVKMQVANAKHSGEKGKRVKQGRPDQAPVYKWLSERKR